MPVKAKNIKDLPLKNELDGSESLLVQDSNGTKQAPLGTIVDEIKQNSQEKIREIESELTQTNAQLSEVNSQLDTKMQKISNIIYLENVSEFVGDGVADDTIVIQKAIDELESIGGGKIVFPFKQTIKVTKQSEKSILTWHKSKYPIRYALSVGDNIEIDLNSSTITCPTMSANGNAPVCIFYNKNASNDDVGNSNIKLKNGVLNSNIDFDNLSSVIPSQMGLYDFVTLLFNNIRNLTLDNITINNTYGYALYICNANGVNLKNDININNVIGCGVRLGWFDNTKNINIDQFNCINCINIYDDSFNILNNVPSNQLYVVAENVSIKKTYFDFTGKFIPTKDDLTNNLVASSNFANTCNNITLNESYCYYGGHKFQDYSKTVSIGSSEYGKPRPDNIYVGKLYMYKAALRIQSNRCTIDNISGDDMLYLLIEGNDTIIKKIYIDGCGVTELKGEIDEIHVLDATFKNCQRIVNYSNSTSKIVKFDKLTFIRNNDDKFTGITGTNLTYLADFQRNVEIGKLLIINDSTKACKSDLCALKASNSYISEIVGINKNNVAFTNEFVVTLDASKNETNVNLGTIKEGYVFKEFNDISYDISVIPLNTSAHNLNVYSANITNYGYWFKMKHDTSVGDEKYLIRINKILRSSPTWN